MRLIGEMEAVRYVGKCLGARADRRESGARAAIGAIGLGSAALGSPETAAQRFGAHADMLGPFAEPDRRTCAQLVRKQVGPVERRIGKRDELFGKGGGRSTRIARGEADKRIGIIHAATNMGRCSQFSGQVEDEDARALCLEAIEVRFERMVDQRVAGAHVEAAFVARFLITALEHDRDESVVMAVARAQFVRMMVEQPERRIGETG